MESTFWPGTKIQTLHLGLLIHFFRVERRGSSANDGVNPTDIKPRRRHSCFAPLESPKFAPSNFEYLYNFTYIFTQHVEEKPISDVTFLDYGIDDLSSNESESDVEQVSSHFRTDDDYDPVDNDQKAKNAEENEPEPKKDVDLLIDNVERQETKSVVLLHLARSSELVERTFGHAWKHVNQGVKTILLVLLGKGDHL